MRPLPKQELIRFGLYDPAFRKGFKRGFAETFRVAHGKYSPFPKSHSWRTGDKKVREKPVNFSLEEKQAHRPTSGVGISGARERYRLRGILPSTMRGAHRVGTYRPTETTLGPTAEWQTVFNAPKKKEKPFVPSSSFKPFNQSVATLKRQSRRKLGKPYSPYGTERAEADVSEKERGEYATYRSRGYDPDHLGDLIAEAEERRFPPDYIARLIDRDRWIDETYGPLSEQYEDQPYTGKYDPRRVLTNLPLSPFDPAKRVDALAQGQVYPDTEGDPTEYTKEAFRLRKEHVRGPLMTVEDFQKKWLDPRNRSRLRKMPAIYDPRNKRVIQLHHKWRWHDPKKYPKPIDIYGYADQHAGVMLRLVPEVPGMSPIALEESVDPRTGGMVKVIPKGSLVEIQAKYPPHQFDNEILPRMLADPTNEIDIKTGRIVRRGKVNFATNIFIDRDQD
jgi:hypothetical protein